VYCSYWDHKNAWGSTYIAATHIILISFLLDQKIYNYSIQNPISEAMKHAKSEPESSQHQYILEVSFVFDNHVLNTSSG
jgi:hypothetical protein